MSMKKQLLMLVLALLVMAALSAFVGQEKGAILCSVMAGAGGLIVAFGFSKGEKHIAVLSYRPAGGQRPGTFVAEAGGYFCFMWPYAVDGAVYWNWSIATQPGGPEENKVVGDLADNTENAHQAIRNALYKLGVQGCC